MQVELKRLQRETGITFIFVTHDQEEALTMSDRIAVMVERQDPADRHRRARSTSTRPTASSPTSSARPIFSQADADRADRRRGAAGCALGNGERLVVEAARWARGAAARGHAVAAAGAGAPCCRRRCQRRRCTARSATWSISAPTPITTMDARRRRDAVRRAAAESARRRPAFEPGARVGARGGAGRRPGAGGLMASGLGHRTGRGQVADAAAGACARRTNPRLSCRFPAALPSSACS